MDAAYVGDIYAEHLTEADLQLLAEAAGHQGGAAELRRDPAIIPDLLDHPRVFAVLFGRSGSASRDLTAISPFLLFAAAVHRAAAELAVRGAVPYPRVPAADVRQMSGFLESPSRRLFLAELLSSFVRVTGGRYWVRTEEGERLRELTELDLPRLAEILDAVPETDRPGVLRRLGDVALFLAGVLPGYAIRHVFGGVDATALWFTVRGAAEPWAGEPAGTAAEEPAVEMLEYLGSHWYRRAWELAPVRSARLAVLPEVAEGFRPARRVLNYVAGRYLFAASGR
ncbi:hypothetical protein TBS_22270 [Thermobispora bispora]|jgi:hypothetical protein|uniref:Uncharacterized protein n=1 Tax=Thermobispora bispora (strain ATCC 19993 / DSM 43833 / CBS 139.67 / JCM 10125 / KCTC 9307 / NBRC 14880 / R51) TaxID=469371 RepID=D6Y472_THEBD|nr:hypothetical protein [Thermobispora bispora]ADG87126.1 hypothetical protein Tbis_0398 [Thermobispora bispora DSM 43833]MDI9580063.1 hypothetical protein [Thermobispora sp.]